MADDFPPPHAKSGDQLHRRNQWNVEIDRLVDDLNSHLGETPYDPTPEGPYTAADLYRGFEVAGFESTVDNAIYRRAQHAGGPTLPPAEQLAQRLHDYAMSLALDDFRQGKDLVGVMGGHALERGTTGYHQAAFLGRAVAQLGYCVVTGGGPGAMEAANFGALSAAMAEPEVSALLDALATSPPFAIDVDGFVDAALNARAQVVNPVDNLSVPTWFYGHEPSNPFATQIVKYFSNSEREDGLLAIAKSGIVFLAGGPGTIQEVFQDAAQNAYQTFGEPSPMIFLDPPDDIGHWKKSGALEVLDHIFKDQHGKRRPGWNRIATATNLQQVIAELGTPTGSTAAADTRTDGASGLEARGSDREIDVD